jgi:Family of unknown function (DUF6220)
MRRLYLALAGLLLFTVFAQFFLAATGGFDRPRDDESFALHMIVGTMVVPAISLLATVVATLARAPGRLVGLTILPVGLVVLQMLIGAVARIGGTDDETTVGGQIVFGLHAINGLAILAVAWAVFAGARTLLTTPQATASTGTAQAPAPSSPGQ